MWKRLRRLFVIKTRWEAWLVIWAIALGAVERGNSYLSAYPGALGWMFFFACTGVVFLAGAKLLDAVRPAPVAGAIAIGPALRRHEPRISRNRPSEFRRGGGAGSRPLRRRS